MRQWSWWRFGGRALHALVVVVWLGGSTPAGATNLLKPGSRSPLLAGAIDHGRANPSDRHHVVVGLALRDREGLEKFLVDVQDPASPRYHGFLTQAEFNALYAPTEADEAAVAAYLEASGLRVKERFPNRLIVGAVGTVAALERAFGVAIHAVERGGRMHFAAIDEPRLPAHLASSVVGVIGLDDLAERRPRVRFAAPAPAPNASIGANCCALGPNDLVAFYDNQTGFDGTGETIVIAGAYAWKDSDNATFAAHWGLPGLPAGSGQVCTGSANAVGCKFSNQNSIEIALDVEYAHATAPGARILNYMSASTSIADFTVMYNRIVTDNPGHVVSTSWGICEVAISTATQLTDDAIFANANAIGQSWFAASGDNGSLDCNGMLSVDNPANSPHVIAVGGTTPTCSAGMTLGSPACGGYGSEVGWSGSGGGVSQVFARPLFQTGCGVPPGTMRLVPDVALEADPAPGNYVLKNGSWLVVGGTSGAAPQWAGYAAQLAQGLGGGGIGNPGSLLYGLCGTAAYHDITSGSNGDYPAGPGYDMVTGLGTIAAHDLLALAAPPPTTTTSTSSTTSTTATTTSTTSSSSTSVPSTTSSSTTSSSTSSTSSSTSATSSTSTSVTTSSSTPPTTTSSTTTSSSSSSTSSSSSLPTTSSSTSSSTSSTSLTSSTSSSTSTSSSSATSTSSTTSTTAPPTESTTTTSSSTTTTLRCPPAGFAGLRCVLADRPDACDGQTLPRGIERRLRRAGRLVDRAESTTNPSRARRRLERLARLLGKTGERVDRLARQRPFLSDCATPFLALLSEGQRRAVELATGL